MRTHFFTRLITILLVLGVGGSASAETYTIGWGTASGTNSTNFTATSGSVTGILSFTTAKNSASSNPAYNSSSNELRLYYASNASGGSITLTPATGVTITGAVINASSGYTPTVKYMVDGGTQTEAALSSTTYSITEISAASSLKIQNCNTSNTQLRIKTITVTYESAKPKIATDISITPAATTYLVGATITCSATKTLVSGATYSEEWTTGTSSVLATTSTPGVFTAESAGKSEITYKVTPTGSFESTHSIASASVTYTVNDVTASLSAASSSLEIGGTTTTSLSTNSSGSVIYSSSNTDIATVDEDGVVTAVGNGTATITATIAAVPGVSVATSATCDIRVYKTTIYTKVTDAGSLIEGNHYLLVYENGTTAKVMGAVEKIGSNIVGTVVEANFTIENNEITIRGEEVNVLTLSENGTSDGKKKYLFNTSLERKYLSWTSGNTLNVDVATNIAQSWFLEYSGEVLSISNAGTTTRKLQYNTGSPRFACYDGGGQANVALYMEDTRLTPTFTFNSEAKTKVLGAGSFTFAATTNSDGTLSYSSSNTSVATVSSSGEVTLVGVGTTTITASVSGTLAYKAAEGSYELTVVNAVSTSDYYTLVTDVGTLAAGDEILIAYVSGGTAKAMSATQNTNNRGAVDVTKNADATLTPGDNAQVITLEKDGDNFLFNVGNAYLYAASSSNNYLRKETTPDANGNAAATITIDSSTGDATITFQGTHTRNIICYNPNNGNPIFSCYANTPTGGGLPQIYKKSGVSYNLRIYDGNGDYNVLNVTDAAPTLTGNQVAVISGLSVKQVADMPDEIKNAANVIVNGTATSLVLSDYVTDGGGTKTYYPFYVPAEFTAKRVTYSRTNTQGYNTVCLPFAVDIDDMKTMFGASAKIYTLASAATDGAVIMTFSEPASGTTIDAGKPFLIHNTNADENWEIDYSEKDVTVKGTADYTTEDGAKLVGSFVKYNLKEKLGTVDGIYKLNSAGTYFVKATASSTISPFRFYLDMSGGAKNVRFAVRNSSGRETLVEDAPKGDINGDKMVTLVDLTALVDMVKGTVPQTAAADVNSDGKVNQADIDAIVQIIQNTN